MDAVRTIGTHPQPVRYYLRLAVGTFRTMLDLGMLVLGSGLVGLAVAVLGDGLGLVSVGLDLSTGAMLGAAVVIGVVGAFALGIASEGGYGANASVRAYPSLEVAIGRLIGTLIVASILVWVAVQIGSVTSELSYPFVVAEELIRATGAAGFGMALIGVPLMWGLRRGLDRLEWGLVLELPAAYVMWMLATLVVFTMPPG